VAARERILAVILHPNKPKNCLLAPRKSTLRLPCCKNPGQRIIANFVKEDNKQSGDLQSRSPDRRLNAVSFTAYKYRCISG
jgi:hypothetical protein